MGVAERIVYESWLSLHGFEFERIGVNVPLWWQIPASWEMVSDHALPKFTHPDYRADAIGVNGTEVELFEIKEVGNMTGISQLVSYEILFWRSYYGQSAVTKSLVCFSAPDAVKGICEKLGIKVYEIEMHAREEMVAARRGRLPGRLPEELHIDGEHYERQGVGSGSPEGRGETAPEAPGSEDGGGD